ncbi:DegV family protein [Bacillus marinisedimentorum]|uniref:DegV family protein n=1 Tax=Bacillus marinisedimentorum TaxID=1821260 RepID=UPI000A6B3C78|nr:DegV family protein [Bacillus marinisedimentorum]
MRIAWITDSTANLTEEFMKKHHIYSVPVHIIAGDDTYRDGVDISPEELYEKMKRLPEGVVAKTSQPSIGEFTDAYEKLQQDYDGAIAVHLSAALSGTFATSRQGAEIAGFPVEMVDSKLISEPLAVLIHRGIKLLSDGMSVIEIKEELERLADLNETYVSVGNLEQLYRSGRLSSISYFLGSFLKITPIIGLEDGKLEIKEKVRTEPRAWKKMIARLAECRNDYGVSGAYILHVNSIEKAQKLKQEIVETLPEMDISISDLSPAVGVHTGEGTVALSWFN